MDFIDTHEILNKTTDLEELFTNSESLGIKLNPKVAYPARFPPGYLGMIALADFFPYETILTASNSSMLSLKLLNSSDLKQIYSEHPEEFAEGNGGENTRLIVYILSELSLGPSSKWYYFLKSLPTTIETLSDWTPNELKELQDEALMQVSLEKQKNDKECNDFLFDILKNYPIFNSESLNRISWAWKLILTRAYGRVLPYLSLIPVADLFNHNNENTSYFYGLENEQDQWVFDSENEDGDDLLPLKTSKFSYFKLVLLKNHRKNWELSEKAKEKDRKLFLESNK